jgi:hypothetical protein
MAADLASAGSAVPAPHVTRIALRAADVGLSLVEHILPTARRVSQVLINDLADLVTLIESARRLKAREADAFFLRLAAVLALFLGLYGLMLTWLFLF